MAKKSNKLIELSFSEVMEDLKHASYVHKASTHADTQIIDSIMTKDGPYYLVASWINNKEFHLNISKDIVYFKDNISLDFCRKLSKQTHYPFFLLAVRFWFFFKGFYKDRPVQVEIVKHFIENMGYSINERNAKDKIKLVMESNLGMDDMLIVKSFSSRDGLTTSKTHLMFNKMIPKLFKCMVAGFVTDVIYTKHVRKDMV